jgi:hypothetical protein
VPGADRQSSTGNYDRSPASGPSRASACGAGSRVLRRFLDIAAWLLKNRKRCERYVLPRVRHLTLSIDQVVSKQLLPIYDKPSVLPAHDPDARDSRNLIISTPQDTPRFEQLLETAGTGV